MPAEVEPDRETRKRKLLGENEISDWELRIGDYRVFYDIVCRGDRRLVKIKAVGHKIRDVLHINGKEIRL